MEHKERYFLALQEDDGQRNALDLGEAIGLDASQTERILAQLLNEHKLEHVPHKACAYRVVKKGKRSRGKG